MLHFTLHECRSLARMSNVGFRTTRQQRGGYPEGTRAQCTRRDGDGAGASAQAGGIWVERGWKAADGVRLTDDLVLGKILGSGFQVGSSAAEPPPPRPFSAPSASCGFPSPCGAFFPPLTVTGEVDTSAAREQSHGGHQRLLQRVAERQTGSVCASRHPADSAGG